MPWRASSLPGSVLEAMANHPPVFVCAPMRLLVLLVGLCSKELGMEWLQPNPVSSEVNWPDSAFLVKMLSVMCPRTAIKSGNY